MSSLELDPIEFEDHDDFRSKKPEVLKNEFGKPGNEHSRHHRHHHTQHLEQEQRSPKTKLEALWRDSAFLKFWSTIPHYIWSLFVEAFYIPAYRWEWGKFRHWTYEKHGWMANMRSTTETSLEMQAELRREKRLQKKRFINNRRLKALQKGSRHQHRGCRRVDINCGGVRFETQARTLQQFPDTLLGDPHRRLRYWNPTVKEYFFDRQSESFECILHFYQSGGTRLERPSWMPIQVFQEELKFFDLKGHLVDEVNKEVRELEAPAEVHFSTLPSNLLKRKIWLMVEYSKSSPQAQLFSYFSISAIILSTVTYCLETMDMFHGLNPTSQTVDLRDPMFLAETVCVCFFALELVLRVYSCPSIMIFLQSFTNIIDFLSILPFAVHIIVFSMAHEVGGRFDLYYVSVEEGTLLDAVYRILNVIRVFRILKLSRYSMGLRILGQTLGASLNELVLLSFFLMIGVILFSSALFFVEGHYNPNSNFTSIPATFYWAVSTMTTTGFDSNDELPQTIPGKIIGSICAIAGVLTLSLPVPIVVSNFTYFYHRGTQTEKREKKKTYIRSCPFLPTCQEDCGVLATGEAFSKESKLGVKKWLRHAAAKKTDFLEKDDEEDKNEPENPPQDE